ncbi:MAG: T9SS type A sorting domain-containing protein [Saprospiraceae bacterium]|nr:T9SS type A sorting domain-containing protein [Saprospiraceae bacterium]MCF8252652.1 T9SS type A sorting domain-containing protein [Saprospiraceae bacterium]MCF8282851.1 T9SS type A sorting domain-containing protein [Bacteroidales bacterium]MCF8314224.1 T9SS type A sorting domain-containing protein [Saprospiraceae bacterium]MCF8443057.1 T9SS type A sorting domain-containing protein [Saprospiraceae bacterium]
MQKTFFSSIVFLFVWTGATLAQNLPFPESNAIWKEANTTIAGPIFSHTALCGDTLLNGINFSQVLSVQVDSALNITGSFYFGGLRSNNGVVRFKPNDFSAELLLYDFNLQPNDVIDLTEVFLGNTVSRKVDSVKMEMLAGKMRKVIYFEPGYLNAPVEYWMEGIGSNFGLLGRASDPGPDHGSDLLCFEHGTEYHNQTLIECFLPQLPAECGILNAGKEVVVKKGPLKLTAQPNPAGPTLRFSTNQKQLPEACNLKIYTANGKLLKTVAATQPEMDLPAGTNLTPGFYIATLESQRTERVLAHCSFVVVEP